MATNARPPPSAPSNGVITGPPKGAVGGNRKKQKRRAKQAAKAVSTPHSAHGGSGQAGGDEYEDDALGYGEDEDYQYAKTEHYHHNHDCPGSEQCVHSHPTANGYSMPPPPRTIAKGKKKGKEVAANRSGALGPKLLGSPLPAPAVPLPPLSRAATHVAKGDHNNIWNTSSQQERQNIKDFWLSLSENERKSLLKIEKEAVLRKMKQQQKHSCACTVCGRKRTAIEEELEVLYEGYYEELEQYAHHDNPPLSSAAGMVPDPLQHRRTHPLAAPPPPPPPNPHHKTSQMQEHFDEEEFSDEDEDEEYSEDEYSDDEDVEPVPRSGVPDFFNFGQNLTVKDNLLTVADDLLKNDGRKFIEMMEQLAERRMARETEAEYSAANPSHAAGYVPPGDIGYDREEPTAGGDDYDDDEESYDSQEEYDDELEDEEEMGGLTEEQRMQEGRRMFQIFAARMFEQRVLTAYKEKVAAERQQKLLEELEDENKLEAQREAKKQRDAQKKKDKKKQQQAAKAEEKAKREAEKAAEEARVREAEEKKLEEQRRKKEEQRKKRDEERRKQDEERAKKDAEKARRQQEELQRREEAERRAREQKAAEKAKKDEARQKEREEREVREREAKERQASKEKAKEKEREKKTQREKGRNDQATVEREKSAPRAAQATAQPQHQLAKRPSQPTVVAIPGVYSKQPNSLASPHPPVATPAVPKAPTPATQKRASRQGSHASSPKQSQSQISSAPSKSSSPNSAGVAQQQPAQQASQPKAVVQKVGNQQPGPPQHIAHATSALHQQPLQPPPGMSAPLSQLHTLNGIPQMGFTFPGHQAPMMPGNLMQRGAGPLFQHQGPPMGAPTRFGPPGSHTGMPPPGMISAQGRGMGFPFDAPNAPHQAPPGFGPTSASPSNPPMAQPQAALVPGGEPPRSRLAAHSRQQSVDKERFESAANQPIARPAPIQRPSSAKPFNGRRALASDMDDLSKHLGSSALLDDTDEPIPPNMAENRRASHVPLGSRASQPNVMNPIGRFGASPTGFGVPGGGWANPGLPFAPGSGLGQSNWAGLPHPGGSGWANNTTAFAANSGFGPIGGGTLHRAAGTAVNRPLNIRLAISQACKQLSLGCRGETDGFHHVELVLRQVEANRPPLDSLPSREEIKEICETKGDSHNGGGELHTRPEGRSFSVRPEDRPFSIRFSPGATALPDQLRGSIAPGEIGSPIVPPRSSPTNTTGYPAAPGAGRGVGFQSLGAVGSSSAF